MALLSLDLRRHDPAAAAEFTFHSAELSQRLFPGWGLFYSTLLHAALAFGLVSWTTLFPPRIQLPAKHWELTMLPKDVLYLPQLGGGSAGGGAGGGERDTHEVRQGSLAAKSKPGVSYPGSQAIVSDPPNPTNHIQTVLQPELLDPLPIQSFLSLPNMVKLARSAPPVMAEAPVPTRVLAPSPVVGEAEPQTSTGLQLPAVIDRVPTAPEPPKLTLAAAVPAVLQPASAPPPVPAAQAAVPQPQKKPDVAPLPDGRNARTLLALSVSPAPPDTASKVPPGETRGQFAIAMLPNLGLTGLGPGSQVAPDSTGLIGVGDHSEANGRDVIGATSGAPGGKGAGVGRGSGGSGGGFGQGHRSGDAEAGNGSGTKTGPGAGGPGTGVGTGTGAGSGPGSGVFAGMTIQGGEWAEGLSSGVRRMAGPEDQGSYGMTIVSSGNSGGGLSDFGVFRDEPVFTVYINMAKSIDDPAPSWTVQYALATPNGTGAASLSAPFPARKEEPRWPEELALKYAGRMVIVSGVLDTEGRMQGLRVVQSPSSAIDEPLVAALKDWVFRPATSAGQAIAVKVLLGVPITVNR